MSVLTTAVLTGQCADITLRCCGKGPPSLAAPQLSVTLRQVPSQEDGVSLCVVIKPTGTLSVRDLILPPNVLPFPSKPPLLLQPQGSTEPTTKAFTIKFETSNKYGT